MPRNQNQESRNESRSCTLVCRTKCVSHYCCLPESLRTMGIESSGGHLKFWIQELNPYDQAGDESSLFDPSLLPPRICNSKKLESKARTRY